MPYLSKEIYIIAAFDQNKLIGNKNKLPWHLPEDLSYFRATTQGHPILMGRKTYESIGRKLPKRQNIILSTILKANSLFLLLVDTMSIRRSYLTALDSTLRT